MTRFVIHNHFRARDAAYMEPKPGAERVDLLLADALAKKGEWVGPYVINKFGTGYVQAPGSSGYAPYYPISAPNNRKLLGKRPSQKDADDLQRYSGDVIWTSLSENEYNKAKPGSELTIEGRKAVVVDKDIVFNTVAGKLYRVKVRFR